MAYRLSNMEAPIFVTKKQAEKDSINHALAGLAIGFAAGIVVGATVAALTATKSGKEDRCSIKGAAQETAEEVKEKGVSVKDRIKSKIEEKKACCCQDEETAYAEVPLEEEAAPESQENAVADDDADSKEC